MKIKMYGEFINEYGFKSALLGGALAISTLSGQSSNPQNIQTQQQQRIVLSRVSGPIGKQPVSNADLDLVHGILGSKRLVDDFEQRVGDELLRLYNQGHKPDVDNIQIKTYVKDGYIYTESYCEIVESQDGNAYTVFTTRGSIGDSFSQRHDDQVNGLESRLETHYKGKAKKLKTFNISFNLNGQNISYKQSFFVASDKQGVAVNNKSETFEIIGRDFSDLREKLKQQTINQSIDPNSLKIDINQMKVSFNKGNTKINNLSIIFDNVGDLDNRLVTIKQKNAGLTIVEKGNHKGIQWALVIL